MMMTMMVMGARSLRSQCGVLVCTGTALLTRKS